MDMSIIAAYIPKPFEDVASAEIRNTLGKVLIEDNGNSGECAPAFTN
jgi:hypothetical protein